MGLFRQILLILFLTGISLAGLITVGTVFPDALATGSGGFLIYVVGVSIIFLFFMKRNREGSSSERGLKRPPRESPEAATEHPSDKRLEEMRARIRDRKRSRE